MKIEHNAGIFWVIAVLIIVLILLVSYIKMQEGKESNNISECKSGSDCVLQETECCPCSMGGNAECMAKDNATYYQEKLGDCRKDIACIALYNCKFQGCECRNGKCAGY